MNGRHSRIVFWGRIGAVLSAVPVLILGYAGGPDARRTGAPGDDGTCAGAGCHVGTATPGGIELDAPGGLTYTPGQRKTLTVRITGAGSVGSPIYGFQASARLVSNLASGAGGSFTAAQPGTEVLCQDNRPKPAAGCAAATPVEFVQHTQPSRTNSFTFDWTPPAANAGDVRIYVAANVANGDGTSNGDRIYTANFTFTPQAQTAAPQIRAQQPVLQAFLGGERISPGTWVEIYGTNFASATKDWSGLFTNNGTRAPVSIDGISVNIDNKPAFMYFVSANQINAQVPDGVGSGPVKVEVVTPGGRSETTVQAGAVSPALLTTPLFNVGGKQYVAALFASDLGTFVGRTGFIAGVNSRPARPGDVLTIYAVGCGAANPATAAGEVVGGELKRVAGAVSLRIGAAEAQAQGFYSPGAIGLCQINATVPNVGSGDQPVRFSVGGVESAQTLEITIQ